MPVTPREASSVALIRPACPPGPGHPVDIYMMRRVATMRFLGGYYVFPGGKLERTDWSNQALARCRGLTPTQAYALIPAREGPAQALGYWLAAIRECFEEVGVLLAVDGGGHPVSPREPSRRHRFDGYRARLLRDTITMADVMNAEGLYYWTSPLHYYSHWITPPKSPIRFDARFFLCVVPEGQEPQPFEGELSEGAWIAPREGLARWGRGEMPMAEPAEQTLYYLAQFSSLEELLDNHAHGRHTLHGIIDRLEETQHYFFDWDAVTR